MEQTYLIDGQTYRPTDAGFALALGAAHAAKSRPLCLCQTDGVPMYVAEVGRHFIVKRMPETGSRHAPLCASFEPPPELSGLGQVNGTAIVEDTETGITTLKLDFSLSQASGRTAPVPSGREQDTVKSTGSKLTLRGLLHYLWEQGGLSHWVPAMAGKRTWPVVRRQLVDAAATKSAKGLALASRLFVPEAFNSDRQAEIEQRRAAQLAPVYVRGGRTRELMLLIGEVKAVLPARYGFKVVVKHLPDLPFLLDEPLARRMEKRFESELALWNAEEATHLLIIATFGAVASGMLGINELAFMLTTSAWLPIDNAYELQLLNVMAQAGRRYTRGMRYNLASEEPVAVAVTTDTRPAPVAMYVVPPGATKSYRSKLAELIESSAFPSWVWRAGVEACPSLPDVDGFVSRDVDLLDDDAGTDEGVDASGE